MSMFKLGTIGAILQAKNNPRVQCASDIKIGNVFTVKNNGTNYPEEAIAFADAATAKGGEVWVCGNIIDTPELMNSDDFVVKAGNFIRAYRLDDLVGLPVEISTDLCATAIASVSVGDILAPKATTFLFEKEATADYKIALQVMKKAIYNGKDFTYVCKVIKQA